MKKINQPTHKSASSMAAMTVATGTNGWGGDLTAGRAAMQKEKVPRNIPSVHWVLRSLTKLTRIRGENWVEASVSVIRSIANTIDTTVMIEPAMAARIVRAT